MSEHTPAPTPSRSLYGFFMYIFSNILLGIYCIWAFIPDEYLHYLGIYYYPQKYWSTAVPIQGLVALTIFAFLIYPSINLLLNTDIDNLNTIRDSFSIYSDDINVSSNSLSDYCICTDSKACMRHIYTETPHNISETTVPNLYDLDIRFVSQKLYTVKS